MNTKEEMPPQRKCMYEKRISLEIAVYQINYFFILKNEEAFWSSMKIKEHLKQIVSESLMLFCTGFIQ